MKRRTLLSKLLVLGGSSSLTVVAKESKALPASRIQAAASYSEAQRGKSLLIIHDGRIVCENYTNGYKSDELQKIYSGTKAFWTFSALAAQESGLIDLDERVSKTITEWQDVKWKSRITVRELLNFTSGLDPTFDLHEDGIKDRDAIAIGRPIVAEPGSAFIYGPCSLQVFHAVMKRKLAKRGESPTHYLEKHVLAPLGLGPQRYVADRSGNPLLAAGMVMTARMWSGFAKMLAHEGRPLVSDSSFHEAARGTSANRSFGLGVWNNSNVDRSGAWEVDVERMLHEKWPKQQWSRACLCKNAPSDLVACIGSGCQRIYAVPSMDLAIVRQGRDSGFSDAEFLRQLFGR